MEHRDLSLAARPCTALGLGGLVVEDTAVWVLTLILAWVRRILRLLEAYKIKTQFYINKVGWFYGRQPVNLPFKKSIDGLPGFLDAIARTQIRNGNRMDEQNGKCIKEEGLEKYLYLYLR